MERNSKQRRVSLAITGASGVCYGLRILEVLSKRGHRVDLMISKSALKCLQVECDLPAHPKEILQALDVDRENIQLHQVENIASSLASGSSVRDLHAGLIIPCSMGTAARIAFGNSSNLIERHADVLIKERIPLVLVPRETPLSSLHLENLLKLSRLGCYIVPAMPGFYHRPKSKEDLVDHLVGKVLDTVKLDHDLYQRWQGE